MLICLSNHDDDVIMILFFYFNTASGVCQSLRVQLQNNAFKAQREREGTYLLTSIVVWFVTEEILSITAVSGQGS